MNYIKDPEKDLDGLGDVVRYIASRTGTTQVDTRAWLTAIIECFEQALLEGRSIVIPKHLSIRHYVQKERSGISGFGDKQAYTCPAKRRVKFVLSPSLVKEIAGVSVDGGETNAVGLE